MAICSAGGQLIGVYLTRSDATTEMRYFHSDRLGSLTLITNAAGAQIERLAYEAYGKRRYPNGADDPASALYGVTTDRGFTAHEHLDEIALIHMNGRIYDPLLGKFMTPDSNLQNPLNLQSYNRYSYALNNPLMYTDPTGYFSLGGLFRAAAVVAVAYFTGGAAYSAYMGSAISAAGGAMAITGAQFASASLTASILGGAAGGFAAGLVASGGNFDVAFRGALSGGLAGGVGSFFGNSYTFSRVLADSAVGGASAVIQGGRFSDGFKNGFGFSAFTYVGIKMREYELQNSAGFPGQIKDVVPFRGVGDGGLAGERTVLSRWIESGAADRLDLGDSMAEAMSTYEQFVGGGGIFGGIQGGRPTLFGIPYARDGFVNYIVEGFSGPHDFINHRLFYQPNGTGTAYDGIRYYAGEAINAANVLLVAPIVLPSLVPDAARSAFGPRKK